MDVLTQDSSTCCTVSKGRKKKNNTCPGHNLKKEHITADYGRTKQYKICNPFPPKNKLTHIEEVSQL
jgi:hypothetical protein